MKEVVLRKKNFRPKAKPVGLRVRVPAAIALGVLLFLPMADPGPAASGMPVIGLRVRELALFAAWALVILLVGLAATNAVKWRPTVATLEAAASFLIGTAVVGSAFLAVGLAGVFDSVSVRVLGIVLSVLAVTPTSVARMTAVCSGVKREWVLAFTGASGRWLAAGTLGFVAVLLLMSLGPGVGWDGAMYHLDIPAQFVADSRISLPDDNLHVAFISAPQMAAAVPMAAGTTAYLAFSQALSFLGVVVLVGTSLARWISPYAGKLAVLLLFASTGLLAVSSLGQADTIMVFGILTVLLLVISIEMDSWTPDPVLIGLAVAAAFLTKYQAIPYLIGVASLFGFLVLGRRLPLSLGSLVVVLGTAMALAAPFLVKNWILLGAPLYPFFADRLVDPWIGVVGVRIADSVEPVNVLASARRPFNVVDWVIRPESLTVEESGRYFGLPFVSLFGFYAFFTRRRRLAAYLMVPTLVGGFLVVIASRETNLRYLLPVLPIVAMLSAIAFASVAHKLGPPSRWILTLAILAATAIPFASWLVNETSRGRLPVGVGIESVETWQNRASNLSQRRLGELADVIQSDLTGDGRVLLLYEARGLTLGPRVIQDNVFTTWSTLGDALEKQCLQRDEVNYVVLGTDVYEYLLGKGVMESELLGPRWNSFRDRCLELDETIPGYEIYRVRSN